MVIVKWSSEKSRKRCFVRSAWLAILLACRWASAMSYPPYDIYPYLADSTDNPPLNYTKVCEPGRTGEENAAGSSMQVWQDYVAGTDPTDVNDRFTAEIHVVDNVPVISWSPVLSATEAAKRVYTIYGRTSLFSGDWTPVPSGQASNYNFFKVVVQMK